MNKIPGITKQDEEKMLAKILKIAEQKFESTKLNAQNLENELHAMQQEFDESDKEQQALWHNTDARFKEVTRELNRAAQARRKPYFGRIDFTDPQGEHPESYYIGRSVIAKDPVHPEVIDWRAPIASVYYDSSLGPVTYSVKGEGRFEIDLKRKRTYEIENDTLKDFYDSDVVANDELLTKYLAKNKRAVLSEIIATIQQEQNEVIRKKPQHNMIIQGAAGSGKTTVAMHRISYILYNFDLEFKPEDFYIIGSNQVLLNYITGVLPELNVYGVSQMTMEQLFVRLLYEAWDPKKYSVRPVVRGVTEPIKGTKKWFDALKQFAKDYEWSLLPIEDVVIEKTHAKLLSEDTIRRLLEQFDDLSRADKISMLSERLLGKLENEISGKYYSYTAEEKKKLVRFYTNYFGKREWKGDIFELYRKFIYEQQQEGVEVAQAEEKFDVYDLAALAYLYKRLQETEIIREAGHVVIDEAQDFGMMAYHALKYCLSTCTYTIMGDVSQNISLDYGLNDWQELRDLMLPEEFDYFGLLRKSYRNTVEISDYATEILHHGSFQIYPVQPIIRHGEEVVTKQCASEETMVEEAATILKAWEEKGLETLAVVCKDQESADKVKEDLSKKIPVITTNENTLEFGAGVMVLSLEYTKGLEFDAVLIYDASAENYPLEDGYVKRLYVAATRALHELAVLYKGQLTDLIATKVPEEKKKQAITENTTPVKNLWRPQEEKTHEELAKEHSRSGEKQMQERHYIGPRRIVISEEQKVKNTPRPQSTTGQSTAGQGTAEQGTALITGNGSKDSTEPVRQITLGESGERTRVEARKLSSYYEQQMQGTVSGKRKIEEAAKRKVEEFGGMPDEKEMRIEGHSKVDCSVRMIMKNKRGADLISSYGTLHVEVVDKDQVRICFAKGTGTDFGSAPASLRVSDKVSFGYRETKDAVEIMTDKFLVRIPRRTGEVQFLDKKGKVLLSENVKEPHVLTTDGSRSLFAWEKKENLFARTPDARTPLSIGQSARVISFGTDSDEMPGIFSDKGYEMTFPAGRKTMCCNVSIYGNYIWQEGNISEYYFRAK